MRTADLTDPTFAYDPEDPAGYRTGLVRPRAELGAQISGVSLYELPPGQSVCPYHYEHAEEEWAMPLTGPVTVRDPDGEHQLAPMQLVFFPRGPEGAHQLRNDGDEPVRLLMFSNVTDIAVTTYPDSDKVGVWTPSSDARDTGLYRRATAVDYWTDQPPV